MALYGRLPSQYDRLPTLNGGLLACVATEKQQQWMLTKPGRAKTDCQVCPSIAKGPSLSSLQQDENHEEEEDEEDANRY
jgi:hypothetical protein